MFLSVQVALSLIFYLVPQVQASKQIEYQVKFQGLGNKNLIGELKKASNTIRLQDHPPATMALLRRRAKKDIPSFREILQAYSYYQGQIEVKTVDGRGITSVVFEIETGPRYVLHQLNISTDMPSYQIKWSPPSANDLGLELNKPAMAQSMSRAYQQLRKSILDQGYVFCQVSKPVIIVNHDRNWVDLQILVHLGPKARFGQVKIHGLQTIKAGYVREKIPWSKGETYQPELTRDLKKSLIRTELFSSVIIEHAKKLNSDGSLPLTIEVSERPHHEISAGLRYDTDIGFGTRVSWEDKNLFGRAEDFRVYSQLSQDLQEINANLRLPQFFGPDKSLSAQGIFKREDTEAYTGRSAQLSLRVEKKISEDLTAGAGLAYKISHLENNDSEHFHLISWPLLLDYDTRNAVLNPSSGGQLKVQMTPFTEIISKNISFLKASLAGKWFYPLLGDKDLVWAVRSRIGSISGASNSDVPADERFYCGGGGSIRGYPYQEIGPYEEGDPIGGRSLIEISNELRWQWSRHLGSAVFLDMGNAYAHNLPDLSDKFYFGAGLGLRYFTSIAPLRLDIAFPINEDEDMDIPSCQFYISIGQAF